MIKTARTGKKFEEKSSKKLPNLKREKQTEPVRGYVKLSDAANAFNYDFRNKVVLDIGSSTGGFTEYALSRGAKKVIAVEKGSHQMKAPLRFDPRIELHEKTDIFDIKAKELSGEQCQDQTTTIHPVPDVIVADVSFISLRPILKHVKKYLADTHTDFLVMLKPQFEATPSDLNKGVVKNEKIRRQIIKDFELWLKQNGFLIIKKRDNTLHGKTGNLERFFFLKISS